MADIGTLVVRLSAESAQMRAELDKVQSHLKRTNRAVEGMQKGFANVGKMIAGALTVGAVTAFAAKIVASADALQDMSDKLGASAAQLGVIQLAATQSGGSVEGVNVALGKMTTTLGDALAGNKSAVKAFDSLGLSFAELSKLSPDQAFQSIIKRLGEIDNKYERAAIAQDIFGKGAKELGGLMADGGKAIEEVKQRLDAMGASLTDLDYARIGIMKDEAGFAATAFMNLGTKILGTTAPAIGVMISSFSNVISSMGGTDKAGRALGVSITFAVKGIEVVAHVAIGIFQNLKGYIYGVAADAMELAGKFSEAAKITAAGWRTTSDTAFVNAKRANDAAIQAGRDMLNAGKLFDAEAEKLDQRAREAAARMAAEREASAKAAAEAARKAAAQRAEDARLEREAKFANIRNDARNTPLVDSYEPQRLALDKHLRDTFDMEQKSVIERLKLTTDLETFRAGIMQSFGMQQLDAEAVKNQSILGLAGELFTALGGESSKLFKVQKAFALANAIISTAQGVTKFLAVGNWGAAAKVAAAGAIQIIKIKATNPGGGSGASSQRSAVDGGTGGTSQAMPDNAPGIQQQEPQRIAQVVVQGNLFSGRETADWLINQLSDAVNNRDVVFINGNSRQAGTIGAAA